MRVRRWLDKDRGTRPVRHVGAENRYLGKVEIGRKMRSKFYIGAYGEQSVIRALHANLNFPSAEIKPLRRQVAAEKAAQWMWRSPYQKCSGDYPEDEAMSFLNENLELLQQLKLHRNSLQDLAVVIVCYLEKNDRPQGYSISSNLVRVLADVNASLEIDIEALLEQPREN